MHKDRLIDRVLSQLGGPGKDEAAELRRARGLILAGRVRLNGTTETRVRLELKPEDAVEILGRSSYASRAAHKLKGALEAFAGEPTAPVVRHRAALDVGAAHGGFTQVLLEKGARRVYALDVAYGILDYSLRTDPRVVLLERRNVRHLSADWLAPEDVEAESGLFVVCDVSFMSLVTVAQPLAALARSLSGPLDGILLLKPQFEASHLTEGGVLADPSKREEIVRERVVRLEQDYGVRLLGQRPAVLPGSAGNQEYVLRVQFRPGPGPK